MTQISFPEAERAGHRHETWREKLLRDMEVIVSWSRLMAAVEAVYPKRGNGRPSIGLERMLRLYVLQLLFGLSDAVVEDALYDTPVFARFIGMDLREERALEATTPLRFRHLLERHDRNRAIFEVIAAELRAKGPMLKQGALIDTTVIAPSSTKNAQGKRDPEMHSTRKGNNWSFGVKVHAGVDAESGLVQSAEFTAAHAEDVTQAASLLHGEETDLFADADYTGVTQREEVAQAIDAGRIGPRVRWQVAVKRSHIVRMLLGAGRDIACALEKAKAAGPRPCRARLPCNQEPPGLPQGATVAWPATPRTCAACLASPTCSVACSMYPCSSIKKALLCLPWRGGFSRLS